MSPACAGSVDSRPVTDPAASLEELLVPLLGRAYGIALRLTRNPADAEDLVQEAAYYACRGFHTFAPGTNFRAWFFRILTNRFRTRYRRDRHRATPVELEDTPELRLRMGIREAGLYREEEDPAAALMERLDAERVGRAIDLLPGEYRVAAALYFMQDCSYQEIAEILGVPLGTVRSRLHRGRRILHRRLWALARERGIVPAPGAPSGGA